MDFQREEMLKQLKSTGWMVNTSEHPISQSYWWAWEIICLKNTLGKTIFLTFLVDPQLIRKKEHVIAAGFSDYDPYNYEQASSMEILYLNKNWKRRWNEILESINEVKSK